MLLSVKVPVAVNCAAAPAAMEALVGVTLIDVRTAAVTVNPVEPLIEPLLAAIVAVPRHVPWANPPELMVATWPEVHVVLDVSNHVVCGELVKSCCVPSL